MYLYHNCFWKLLFDLYLKSYSEGHNAEVIETFTRTNNLLIFRAGAFKLITDES